MVCAHATSSLLAHTTKEMDRKKWGGFSRRGGKVGPQRPTSVRGKSLSLTPFFSLLCQKKITHRAIAKPIRWLRCGRCDFIMWLREARIVVSPFTIVDRNKNMQIFRPLSKYKIHFNIFKFFWVSFMIIMKKKEIGFTHGDARQILRHFRRLLRWCHRHHPFFRGPRGKKKRGGGWWGRAVISYSITISLNFDFNDLLELHYAINTATPSLSA